MSERAIHRFTTVVAAGACIIVGAACIWLSVRDLLACHAARQGTIGDLQTAVRLSPQNAEYHDQLGVALLFSGDWSGARKHLQTATTLNPHDPRYWLDLSRLNQIAGDTIAAGEAADQAVATGRTCGWVLWEAGLLYLSQQEQQKALGHFRRTLEENALPADRVVDICWRATGNADMLLALLMPDKPQPYAALLNTLIRDGNSAAADKAWRRMLNVAHRFPPEASFGYIDSLLRQGRGHEAAEAWHAFVQSNSALRSYVAADNLVENGGFELDLLNGGFDWRYSEVPGAMVSLATDRAASGVRSLKLTFNAAHLWDAPILHYVPVEPGTRYRFSAHVATDSLWTPSGPRLRLRDPVNATDYVLTDDFTGSLPWTRVHTDFTTGPTTRVLTMALVRLPGNSSISGTLWLDDVSLLEAR